VELKYEVKLGSSPDPHNGYKLVFSIASGSSLEPARRGERAAAFRADRVGGTRHATRDSTRARARAEL
jgi:hypothetical protein